jgi:hypothetical protein
LIFHLCMGLGIGVQADMLHTIVWGPFS